MSAKTQVAPTPASLAAYHAAMASLTEADERLKATQQRITTLTARIAEIDLESARLESERNRAFAHGDLEQASGVGRSFAANRSEREDAVAEAKALTAALDGLWVSVLDAEQAADRAHSAVFNTIAQSERAALVKDIQTTAIRAWRADLASGSMISFVDWWKALGGDVGMGDAQNLSVDVGLPIAEPPPASSLIPGNARRSSPRRADIAEMRDRIAAEAADTARKAA